MQLLQHNLDMMAQDGCYDLCVVGAGGAGLFTALFAALKGKKVLIIESTAWVGGTTALSAGTTWVPGNPHSASVNAGDNLSAAERYLDAAVGERSPKALRQAFLQHGHAAVQLLEEKTQVRFRPYAKHPDYMSRLAGSTLCGRALEPLPFDGRLLGEWFGLLRPPIPEFTVLGGMMVDRSDIGHLLGMTKSWASLKHAAKLLTRYALDRLRYARGTRLVMGNALVARLLYSLQSSGADITLALQTQMTGVERKDSAQALHSMTLIHAPSGDTRRVNVRQGVVLASGGFNRHPQLRQQLLGHVPMENCPAAPGHTGQAHDLAKRLGAVYGKRPAMDSAAAHPAHAFWAPVSQRMRPDGSMAVFPHFVLDRAKPGVVAVNAKGERFVNESCSYHQFGLSMQGYDPDNLSAGAHASQHNPAYLVCDARALRAYGLGMVRPGAKADSASLQTFIRDGYLKQAASIEALAQAIGARPELLAASVAQNNANAALGLDPQFHRGETPYERNLGDPQWSGLNPNLGAISEAPFYALQLVPGDIGAATGFATNETGKILDAQGQTIEGLYAVGNDMHSIMGGVYPAPGITIGPSLVFAYTVINH